MNDMKLPDWLRPAAHSAAMPAWLAASRENHWRDFLQHGLPARQNERFKYTDLTFLDHCHFVPAAAPSLNHQAILQQQHAMPAARLAGESILFVFVNGHFMPALSDYAALPAGVLACRLTEAWSHFPDLVRASWPKPVDILHHPFASLNAALFTEGFFFYVPPHIRLAQPVHCLHFIASDEALMLHPYHLMVLGEQSQVVLLEEYHTLSAPPVFTNMVTTVNLGEEATLARYKIQNENRDAIHFAHTFIQQEKNSSVLLAALTAGAQFSRDDIAVYLQGRGAQCQTAGFYESHRNDQYIDYHIDVYHLAPDTQSEMFYKGILDKKSRAVFNGRVYVEKNAQNISAYQANHNVLLCNEAEVYSKPELEIYADAVKCKHGATIGQLDEAALFYLRSRGINQVEASAMLRQGFAEEVLQRFKHESILAHVKKHYAEQRK